MSERRCAQLAAWGSAWLQGTVGFDEVLDAVNALPAHAIDGGLDEPIRTRDIAGPGFAEKSLHPVSSALTDWKRSGAICLRLALPVPGDVRGVGGPTEFRQVALAAGEAVFGAGFGVTPAAGKTTPSSAGREYVWHRAEVVQAPVDQLSIGDADHDLTEAIRDTASVLANRGSTSWLAGVASGLTDARRAGERLNLPASHPPRAVRLIAQAERLSAVFAVIDDDHTGELTAAAMNERRELLSPLRVAVRRALLAGYNAAAEADYSRPY